MRVLVWCFLISFSAFGCSGDVPKGDLVGSTAQAECVPNGDGTGCSTSEDCPVPSSIQTKQPTNWPQPLDPYKCYMASRTTMGDPHGHDPHCGLCDDPTSPATGYDVFSVGPVGLAQARRCDKDCIGDFACVSWYTTRGTGNSYCQAAFNCMTQ